MIRQLQETTQASTRGTGLVGPSPQRLTTTEGAEARRVTLEGREQLEIYDPQNRLVFRFDPKTGGATLNVPHGDLKLNCEQGDIELQAAGTVRTKSRAFEVVATQRIILATIGRLGRMLSRLLLKGDGVRFQSDKIDLAARDISMASHNTRMESKRCELASETTHFTSQKQITEAEVLEEKSTNRYQNTKDMSQVRTGRSRTLISGLCQFRAKKALMRSDEDFKISGDKVHLG